MEPGGEFPQPSVEIKIQTTHQESLNRQLEKLDQSRPEHQVLGDVLKDIYQNYQTLDQQAEKSDNIRYQPRCALVSHEYIPMVDAINNIFDPYNIFPKIETTLKESKDLSVSEIIKKVGETISTNTDVPVIIEPFQDTQEEYAQLENGNIYSHKGSIMKNTLGVHSKQFKSNPEILDDLKKQNYSTKIDYKNPIGDIILINQLFSDNPAVIRTGLHELGHIVEEKTLTYDQEKTEVISALYGIKAGLLMAEIDPQKSADMIHGQIILYNWILTGTVAP